ncbi:exosome complex component rrp45 [Anaeramoeba flamelloides]|uniref:Exosome complex component rrp45 n=1 Tax=Anaeramoeba flamelloides TaxID=1746091 RepID=A0AAV7YKM8_9EUKA|nr:exosome complex component rrp45 [Anaeramoeba flamelloides]
MIKKGLTNNEKQFLQQAIKTGHRVDNRSTDEYRKLKIEFGEKYGQVIVHLGKTKVLCDVTANIVKPFQNRPYEGFVRVFVTLSPISSRFLSVDDRPKEDIIEISSMIDKGIRESSAVDLESLCIETHQKVWEVVCKLQVIDDDGNIPDAVNIATMLGLMHFRLPQISFENEKCIIHTKEEKELIPLSIHHLPICVTIGFFEQGGLLIIDPNLLEERSIDGRLSIMVNTHEEICSIQKGGGTPLTIKQLLYCTQLAFSKANDIDKFITQELEKDIKLKEKKEYDEREKVSSVLIRDVEKENSELISFGNNGLESQQKDLFAHLYQKKKNVGKILTISSHKKKEEDELFKGENSKWEMDVENNENDSTENKDNDNRKRQVDLEEFTELANKLMKSNKKPINIKNNKKKNSSSKKQEKKKPKMSKEEISILKNFLDEKKDNQKKKKGNKNKNKKKKKKKKKKSKNVQMFIQEDDEN